MKRLFVVFLVFMSLFFISASGITKDKVLVFAVDKEFAPYSFISDTGKLEGFSLDLIKLISVNSKRPIEIISASYDEYMAKLKNGKIDGVVGIPACPMLNKIALCSDAVVKLDYAIFVNATDHQIYSIDSLEGTIAGIQKNCPLTDELKKHKNITLVTGDNILVVLEKLKNRQVKAIIANKNAVLYYIQKNRIQDLQILSTTIKHDCGYSIAVRKDAPEILNMINKQVGILRDNGTLEQLEKKWLGEKIIQPIPWKLVILLTSGITLVMFFLTGILWVISLNETVNIKTKQIQIMSEDMIIKDKLAVLGKLAGQIAHELRTPLSIMHNSLYLLRKEGTQKKELFNKRLDLLENKVKLTSTILESILSYSRVKAQAAKNVIVSECINEVIKDLVVPKNIKLKKRIEDKFLTVFIDFHQLYSVIRNLLLNAIQAMDEEGTITIEEFYTKNDSMVNIKVTDTGGGIAKEIQDKIFSLFYTTKATGTGLGLSISKSIVATNKGKITLEKSNNKGTSFVIKLPKINGVK